MPVEEITQHTLDRLLANEPKLSAYGWSSHLKKRQLHSAFSGHCRVHHKESKSHVRDLRRDAIRKAEIDTHPGHEWFVVHIDSVDG